MNGIGDFWRAEGQKVHSCETQAGGIRTAETVGAAGPVTVSTVGRLPLRAGQARGGEREIRPKVCMR